MFQSAAEMLDFIGEAGIESVDLRVTDLSGRFRHVTVPAASFTADQIDRGVGFDGSSLGFTALEAGDLVLRPDPRAAFVDPFHSVRTLGVICNAVQADSGAPFHADPRTVAANAEEHLRRTGVADRSLWSPEFEFYVFASVSVRNDTCAFSAEVTPLETAWERIPPRNAGAYFASPPLDRTAELRERICAELGRAGVAVKYHHHEVGARGQCEIELPLGPLVRQADHTQIVKYFTRTCAHQEGLSATFMPKPLYRQEGSGMHFHQLLLKNGEPVFYDDKGYAGLSRLAHQYVGGILTHGRSLTALTNPSSNSFKRLVPGYEAPVNLFFSLANRSAAIRVPKYAQEPLQKRIEYRPPDGTCNPYLAMAGMLLAGLDGVEKRCNPEEAGFGPFDEDIFKWPADRRERMPPLPRSLEEAIESLRGDADYLERGGVFGPELIETYWTQKWEAECTEIARRPHPFEFELYYDC
jgi:glutamine synthetase